MHGTEASTIRNFIIESCDLTELEDNLDIFGSGIANSIFVIELMSFIESQFSVKITMDDLALGNFNSVQAIECFLQGKRADDVKPLPRA